MDSPSQPDVCNDKFKPSRRFIAAFGSLCILVFTTALDAMALGAAIPV